MSKFEELTAASLEADHEMEHQSRVLRDLELELARSGTSLSSFEYSDLRSRIAQTAQRVEAATELAASRRAELDILRDEAAAKVACEMATAAVDNTLARLLETQATIASKRSELSKIQNEIPRLTQKASQLLFELNTKKETAQRLGA
jgi:hypothetical protein